MGYRHVIIIIIIIIIVIVSVIASLSIPTSAFTVPLLVRGVATGGGVYRYIYPPPKSVYLKFFYVVVLSP